MASQNTSPPQQDAMIVRKAMLVLGVVLCAFIALPFLPGLVWSITLTILFSPVERALRRIVRIAGLSATLTLIMAALVVVVPVILVSGALISEVMESAHLLKAAVTPETWSGLAARYPGLSSLIDWISRHLDPQQLIQSGTTRLDDWSTSIVQGSLTSIFNLLVTFYFLFYLLRDRTAALAAVERLMPFTNAEFRLLVNRVVNTVFASVYGTAAVAALQGCLGGLMFWWLDLPSPIFWGVVMGLLAVVPFLGAFVIWAPAAVLLAMDGHLLSAVILTLWGTIIVGLVDNVIYPILVGRRLALHSMLSFISIIGGLVLFGPHGIVLGPVIVAGSRTLFEIWRGRSGADNIQQPMT